MLELSKLLPVSSKKLRTSTSEGSGSSKRILSSWPIESKSGRSFTPNSKKLSQSSHKNLSRSPCLMVPSEMELPLLPLHLILPQPFTRSLESKPSSQRSSMPTVSPLSMRASSILRLEKMVRMRMVPEIGGNGMPTDLLRATVILFWLSSMTNLA